MVKAGDIVESTDWRERGATREVAQVPEEGRPHYGYCFLYKTNGRGMTRVRLKKDGVPERYRLVKSSQISMEE